MFWNIQASLGENVSSLSRAMSRRANVLAYLQSVATLNDGGGAGEGEKTGRTEIMDGNYYMNQNHRLYKQGLL